MKKEYLIGGLLGVVLCGLVANGVMTFIAMEDSETVQQFAQQLPVKSVPLDVALLETPQPAKGQLSDQEKAEKITAPTAQKNEGTSGLRITLKSGRVMLADACTEFGSQLRCDMLGGMVEVQRQDIESITEVTIVKRFGVEAQPNAGTASETDKKNESGKTAAGSNLSAQSADGRLVKDLTPEQNRRLDQINERKAILAPERERLFKERELLYEDVKNAGVVRTQQQFDALERRIADLEAKITAYNNEVNKLNEEGRAIIDSSPAK